MHLAKPVDPGELVASVESVIDLRELLDNEALKRTLGAVSSLPPPPKLYLQLTRLLRDPQDPAIAAKVLRLCNSAYFSGGREISDMRSAVLRLGHQALLRLVLTIEAFGAAHGSGKLREHAHGLRALAGEDEGERHAAVSGWRLAVGAEKARDYA